MTGAAAKQAWASVREAVKAAPVYGGLDLAPQLGLVPLGYLRSWAYAALDPGGWMLMGPSYASPLALDRAYSRPDGQTVVKVFPSTTVDKLLLSGYSAEVWMQPGVTPAQAVDSAASAYRGGSRSRPRRRHSRDRTHPSLRYPD